MIDFMKAKHCMDPFLRDSQQVTRQSLPINLHF